MDLQFLASTPLFAGAAPEEIEKMCTCLSMRRRAYAKDAYIAAAGRPPDGIGVVLRGGAHIVQEDYWGNRAILTHVAAGDVFGEAFVCAGVEAMPVSVVAAEPCEVLFLDYRRVTTACSNACPFHARLIRNLLGLMARKNLLLTHKITHLARRTTREKLLSYFSEQAARSGSSAFTIPYNRQELADYLSVDRSAMSTALGRLRDEGVLEFRRNWFHLL